MDRLFGRNVGAADRGFRVVFGVTLIVLAIMDIGTPWTWIGIMPLLTAATGWCPGYVPFGIRTCPAQRPKTDGGDSAAA